MRLNTKINEEASGRGLFFCAVFRLLFLCTVFFVGDVVFTKETETILIDVGFTEMT